MRCCGLVVFFIVLLIKDAVSFYSDYAWPMFAGPQADYRAPSTARPLKQAPSILWESSAASGQAPPVPTTIPRFQSPLVDNRGNVWLSTNGYVWKLDGRSGKLMATGRFPKDDDFHCTGQTVQPSVLGAGGPYLMATCVFTMVAFNLSNAQPLNRWRSPAGQQFIPRVTDGVVVGEVLDVSKPQFGLYDLYGSRLLNPVSLKGRGPINTPPGFSPDGTQFTVGRSGINSLCQTFSYSAQTGAHLWTFDINSVDLGCGDSNGLDTGNSGGATYSPDSQTVYLGTDSYQVIALNAKTGKFIWKSALTAPKFLNGNCTLGCRTQTPPTLSRSGDTIFVATVGSELTTGFLVSLNAKTGAQRWVFTPATFGGSFFWSPITVGDDVVYTVFQSSESSGEHSGGHVFAHDQKSGELLWTRQFPGDGYAMGLAVTADGSLVYTNTSNHVVLLGNHGKEASSRHPTHSPLRQPVHSSRSTTSAIVRDSEMGCTGPSIRVYENQAVTIPKPPVEGGNACFFISANQSANGLWLEWTGQSSIGSPLIFVSTLNDKPQEGAAEFDSTLFPDKTAEFLWPRSASVGWPAEGEGVNVYFRFAVIFDQLVFRTRTQLPIPSHVSALAHSPLTFASVPVGSFRFFQTILPLPKGPENGLELRLDALETSGNRGEQTATLSIFSSVPGGQYSSGLVWPYSRSQTGVAAADLGIGNRTVVFPSMGQMSSPTFVYFAVYFPVSVSSARLQLSGIGVWSYTVLRPGIAVSKPFRESELFRFPMDRGKATTPISVHVSGPSASAWIGWPRWNPGTTPRTEQIGVLVGSPPICCGSDDPAFYVVNETLSMNPKDHLLQYAVEGGNLFVVLDAHTALLELPFLIKNPYTIKITV